MNRITAQQARELTEYKEEQPTITLSEIYDYIFEATKKGCEGVTFGAFISKSTIMILENDGYLVEINGIICTIRWC